MRLFSKFIIRYYKCVIITNCHNLSKTFISLSNLIFNFLYIFTCLNHIVEYSSLLQQSPRSPLLNNLALPHHDHLVVVGYCVESVGNRYDCRP